MVFCYKILTESPHYSGCQTPKDSLSKRTHILPSLPLTGSKFSEWSEMIESVPEREWRLLEVLARKRQEESERQRLIDQFHKMWDKEREEMKIIEAETELQHSRYLLEKRKQDQREVEHKLWKRSAEQKLRTEQLLASLLEKERRIAEKVAWTQDKKTTDIIDRSLKEDTKLLLAADRRWKQESAQEWIKQAQMEDRERRASDARQRRIAFIKEIKQRRAITNALNSWETGALKQEISAIEEAKRIQHAAHAAMTHLRSLRLARARDLKQQHARRLALLTQEMRNAIRLG